MPRKLTQQEFEQKVVAIHGNNFDLSKAQYTTNGVKVTVTCRTCGSTYQQRPLTLLQGGGCVTCGFEKSKQATTVRHKETLEQRQKTFLEKAIKVHGDKYDYSKTVYRGKEHKIIIVCPEHGEFEQRASSHIYEGRGCSKCAYETIGSKRRTTLEDRIQQAYDVHGHKYDYSTTNIKRNVHERVTIKCPKHGVFTLKLYSHIHGYGCPACNFGSSGFQKQILSFVLSLAPNSLQNDRTLIKPLELDIVLPEQKLAIECDGLYWHSTVFKEPNYHLNKTKTVNEKGYDLIHIFEDEWRDKQHIVESMLRARLGLIEHKIFARTCVVRQVDTKTQRTFLEQNHIQGFVPCKVAIGLYHNNVLVALATFGHERLALGRKTKQEGVWELLRLCTLLNTNVVGGASKLLMHFERGYKPNKLFSYTDLRWGTGKVYSKLGFVKVRQTKPNYFYVKGLERFNRFGFRKQVLKEKLDHFDPTLSEAQNMENNGYNRIYDCGTILFEKNYKESNV